MNTQPKQGYLIIDSRGRFFTKRPFQVWSKNDAEAYRCDSESEANNIARFENAKVLPLYTDSQLNYEQMAYILKQITKEMRHPGMVWPDSLPDESFVFNVVNEYERMNRG